MLGVNKAVVIAPVQHWSQDIISFLTRPAQILRGYSRQDFRPDLLAGLTVAIVTLPQAIAFALLSDLPPQTGLYTAIIASIAGALWGSSIHLNTGPTNTTSLLVLSTLITIAAPNTPEYLLAAALMAIIVGVIRLVMGLAKLGVLVNFVSDSVIIGLTAGAGMLIFVNQLQHLLRIPVPRSPYFTTTLAAIAVGIGQTHWLSLGLGLITIGIIVGVRRVNRNLPGPLLAMIVTTLLVAVFSLDSRGVIILGELPRGLPPLIIPPITDVDLIQKLFAGSLAVAAIGLVEATSIARVIAIQSGQRLDSNQEFVGQGLANIAAGFFSGYTCAGSFTRSGVNYTAGARTSIANVFAGLFVLLALLTVSSYAALIPRAALAGVLIVAAYGMIDRREMARIWHASRGDTLIMIATMLAALILPLQFAVLSGIIVSIVRFMVRTSTPQVHPVVPDDSFAHFVEVDQRPVCPQLAVISVSGSLYFGATQHVENIIRTNADQHPGQRFLLLRLHLVDHCDISGIHMLESVVRLYRQRGGDVYIDGVRRAVKDQMHMINFDRLLGADHFLDRGQSISYIFHKVLEPSVCIYECQERIFAECQALPKWSYGSKIPDAVSLPSYDIPSWRPSELKERLTLNGKDILLVDVREPREYQQGHVPRAQLIPMRHIPNRGKELPHNQTIVLICRIGRRSRLAGIILKDMGFEQVVNLQGGTLAWEAAGYPLAVE
ncbi:MAG: Thiosulfate sulfurtransferase GlpE [Anaerolineae bacterium]|nr:Thiosulfate sulfurtransferase GlpE [Anaerolineae bacterium]